MRRARFLSAKLLATALLLLGACTPNDENVQKVQQTVVREVANAGNTGSREGLPLGEFIKDEFAAAKPTISWASEALPKDDVAGAGLIGVSARVQAGEPGFPKITLRFKYDPATGKVTYRDALVGKKPLADKSGRQVQLAATYEAVKARVTKQADAKAKAKAKKKAALEMKKAAEEAERKQKAQSN
jgi:hypothetical protein